MVKTRRNFETSTASPVVIGKVATKGKKPKIEEEDSSEESVLDTAPISSKRRLRYNKESHERHELRTKGWTSKQHVCSARKLRSPRIGRPQGALVPSEKSRRHKTTASGKSGLRRRHKSMKQDEVLPSIRRSCRQRRGVYDTLNVKMLTDHRFLQTYESFPVAEIEKHAIDREELEDEEFDTSAEQVNMYDNVKRRHETPTPEKRPRGRSIEDDDGDDEDEENDEEDDGEDSDEGEEEGDEEEHRNKYLLRKKKPVVNRYTAPPMKTTREKKDYLSMRNKLRHNPPLHASPVRRIYLHKRKAMNMSSSTSSSDSSIEKDEQRFEHRKKKSMAKARHRALPVNLTIEDISKGILRDRDKIGSSLADVDPMMIDRKVQFESVGGLGKQIRALKEMILFPLMYPEVFEKFKITPPRGVLFYGPPGTGKTLVARALANECSQGDQKVAFFMRKGADCLSKWVGESERQLRLLFDQAYAMRPSIIFFDEIDGLAPVRSSRQDQIHSSIVSTLLALMDGLDSRGEVVVIGATNRIDAIDPALRRPGRFDREFQFPLPDRDARRSILSIHTKEWEPKLSQVFINEMADYCVGYCGADIKALCTEAALFALKRRYPQVYNSSKKLLLDVDSIEVTCKDFYKATKNIVPAFQRSVASPARVLSDVIQPLLQEKFSKALEVLAKIFPQAHTQKVLESLSNQTPNTGNDQRTGESLSDGNSSSDDDDCPSIYDHSSLTSATIMSRSERYMRRMKQRHSPSNEVVPSGQKIFSFTDELFKDPVSYRPRLLLTGQEGAGQTLHLAPALLHSMEHLSVHCLDLPALYGVAARTPEEACSQLFREARRSSPCVIYMPHIHSLWGATCESLHATLLSLLQDLPPLSPVLLLATADKDFRLLPKELQKLFSTLTEQVLYLGLPNSEERRTFFNKIFLVHALQTPKVKKNKNNIKEILPLAPPSQPRQLSESELKKIQMDEENTLRELRIFLRDVHHKLIMDRRFKEFSKPVDLEEVPDYFDVIDEPMDLSNVMQKIDRHQYSTCADYLLDIDLITSNALKYNPDRDPLDKIIRHRACELRDVGHSLITSQLEPEFEKACEEIIASRQRRGEISSACAPAYVHTAPRQSSKSNQESTVTVVLPSDQPAIEIPLTAVAAESNKVETVSQKTVASHVRRRRHKSYSLGPRRKRIPRKKGLTNDIEKANEEENGSGEKEYEQNGTEVVNENPLQECQENSVDINIDSHGSRFECENDEDDKTRSHNVNKDPQCHIADSYQDNADIDGPVENGDLEPEHQIRRSFRATSYLNVEARKGLNVLANGLTPIIAIKHCSQSIRGSCPTQNDKPDNEVEEIFEKVDDTDKQLSDFPSEETVKKWTHELQTLLTKVVDMTEGCTVEVLERYHSVLQFSVHQHRHIVDKTKLIENFHTDITSWKYGTTSTR